MTRYGSATGRLPRAEIETAWRRAALNGLTPTSVLDIVPGEVDPDSRLLRAARPVLDVLSEQLLGTRYCVVLADRDARVLDRRLGRSALETGLDDIRLIPGARYSEKVTGTTGIGTVLELRKGLQVTGAEHFIDALKDFTCYGHPIIHPVTRRLEGVLDITGWVADSNDLLAPFLICATREIEQRLMLGASASQQFLLAAFQSACRDTHDPVVAIGDDVCLSNASASRELGPQDHAVLRAMSAALTGPTSREALRLTSGRAAVAELAAVSGNRTGVLVRISPVAAAVQVAVPATPWRAPHTVRSSSVVIRGEAGSGKTRWARERAAAHAVVLDGADDLPWSVWAATARRPDGPPLVVENLHLLSDHHLARLRRLLTGDRCADVIGTVSAGAPGPELAALVAVFDTVLDVPPLRDRLGELPAIAGAMLDEIDPGAGRRLSTELLDLLLDQPWPGNLHELCALLRDLVAASPLTVLSVDALPATRRRGPRGRPRTPLEEAEYRAILFALRGCDGNKVRAARQLGISRATLYSKLRTFKIPV